MPLPATPDTSSANMRRDVLWPVCCLGLLLGLLFLRSFDPSLAVFSNDGPLGQASAATEYGPSILRGYWQDLNWIGIEQLPAFPTLGYLSILLFGPVGHGKFVAPISLLVLGLSAWLCLYRMGFNRWVCLLGSIAAAFDMSVFSNTCWGLCGWTFQRAFAFLALASLVNPRNRHFILRLMLAGSCIGLGIMEGFDVGAIFSLYVGAFVAFQAWVQKETLAAKLVAASSRVALVALCAALIAAHALTSLIGTQVKGVAEMQQDAETKRIRWDAATQWSLPKIETLQVIIPGLFGYYMIQNAGDRPHAKSYWGSIAQTPGWEQHRKGMVRHTGSGDYAGVLVVLVAIWATAQGLRRKGGPFDQTERKWILFWAGAAVVSLLFAFGRHAPFYQLVYSLPYFSTIRNPVKFLYPMHFALVILFGYGLQGLWRQHIAIATGRALTGSTTLKSWWKIAPSWDRKWTVGSISVIAVSLVGWLMYASSKGALVRRLQNIGFPDLQLATSMANQSLSEVGWFVLFLGLSAGVVTLIMSGRFTGKRSRLAAACLGLVLVADVVRANLPWIMYYDYKEKYATNPIIDFLKKQPYDHRVTAVVSPLSRNFLVNDQDGVFPILSYEWLQHQFPYCQVQSLDVISMARPQAFDEAYMAAFRPTNASEIRLCARLWELTNTRYVLGMTGYLEALNQQFDADKRRFAVHTAFNIVPKPGLANATKLEDLTAVPGTNGQYALFEFSGALPRARLFSEWQVSTNDQNTLQRLKSPDFDPERTVLISDELPPASASSPGTNAAGSVEFASYSPKLIRLNTKAATPAIFLLNDRHHPDWKVFVDGRPEALLRCNYAMRGVYLTPGNHTVEFRYEPPAGPLYLTCASIAVAFGICFFLAVAGRSDKKKSPAESADEPLSSHRKSK